MRLRTSDKKAILQVLPLVIALCFTIHYWYISIPMVIFCVCYFVWEARYDEKKRNQQPILPNPEEAERKVMDALHRKVSEYKPLESIGMYCNHVYNADDGIRGLESEMKALRKNLKSTGCYFDGDYHFCEGLKIQLLPHQDAHFSSYFNEQCDKLYKNLLHDGIDKCKEDITLLSDYMLVKLKVRIKKEYIALKLYEAYLHYHISYIKETAMQKAREELKARRDYERAIREATRNEEQIQKEVEKYRGLAAEADSYPRRNEMLARVAELEKQLQEALAIKERAQSMAQQTRAGYVYVISNEQSFGPGVYKIGMTRRLNPMDRVNELGDASVPFPFLVHYMIYTDDAPRLETELHQRFASYRMNEYNYRKEFFRVPLDEITSSLIDLGLLENEKKEV